MQRSVEKKQWYVSSYLCHVTDNQVSEVWSSSGFPWIAANVFLRETSWQRSWATRTTRECAYVLKELAVWLSANSFSFWDPEFRLGGRIMLAYRDYLFADTRFANSTGRRLSIETTDRRLKLAFELCRYWLGEDESIRGERRALNKIGGLPIPFDVQVSRMVGRDCLINFEGRQYAVPYALAGRMVQVRGAVGSVQIIVDHQVVQEYPRGTKARLLIDQACYEPAVVSKTRLPNSGSIEPSVLPPSPLGRIGRTIVADKSWEAAKRPLAEYEAILRRQS